MSVAVMRGRNVLGEPLEACCHRPRTGYFRDGFCRTSGEDTGTHVLCARMTSEFLEFTRSRGNDLITPIPAAGFPGLKAGDCWCLCARRWREALVAGMAPPIRLAATHEKALEFVTLDDLRRHAIEPLS